MSKASDYKKAVEEMERQRSRAEGMKPVFTLPGQGPLAFVSEEGGLVLQIGKPLNSAEALKLAAWIVKTFGEPSA